jgi:hypothetical protein
MFLASFSGIYGQIYSLLNIMLNISYYKLVIIWLIMHFINNAIHKSDSQLLATTNYVIFKKKKHTTV